jgi:hypothetical protein
MERKLRADIRAPTCWNGQLTNPDHKSHLVYKEGDSCPTSHPTELITVRIESSFDLSGIRTPRSLHWAQNDSLGRGYHADIIEGWERAPFEEAVNGDSCSAAACGPLESSKQTNDGIKKDLITNKM